MALDEATASFLQQTAGAGATPLHEMTPRQARRMASALRTLYGPGPDIGEIVDHPVPVPGGSITVRSYSPSAAAPTMAMIYFHGGGWVTGTLDEFDTLARTLVVRTGATVLSVDYRLAPEHRYPTAADDAWAALVWVAARWTDVPLVVAGDSAGGNLAAVVAQRATRAGGPRIAAQVLAYPVVDADFDTASYRDPANQLVLGREAMIWFWDHYTEPSERSGPDAAPLRAADLTGLPPAVVLIAEHDPLRDEGTAYAERLRAAGVPVEHRLFTGQMHGFFTMVNILPGAEAGLDFVAEKLGKLLAAFAPTDRSENRT